MATGFDALAQAGANNAQRQMEFANQQRVAGRNAQAALIENALNNPDTAPADRAALLQQHAALFQPHEAPDLFKRLSGLIHGQQPAPAPVVAPPPTHYQNELGDTVPHTLDANGQPVQPQPMARDLLGVPISDPAVAAAHAEPLHPMATSHPILDRLNEGLDALGHHLKGFAQPVAAPTPESKAADADVVARNYASPVTIARESAKAIAETKGTQQIDLEKEKRKRYLLTRSPESKALDSSVQDAGYDSFDQAPPEVQAKALQDFKKNSAGLKLTTAIVVDPASSTGFSKVTGNQMTGEVTSTIPGITPPRGFIPTTRVNHSTDQYGNTTSSLSTITPQVPGGNAPAVGPNTAPVSKNAPTLPSNGGVPVANATSLADLNASIAANKGKAGVSNRKAAAGAPTQPISSAAPKGPAILDANDQIPDSAAPNPQIRQFAQDLLDDQDTLKIPAKARAAAEQVARQFGWSQGAFTPREQRAINLTGDFLDKFAASPSLKILDDPFLRAQAVTALHHAEGLVGQQLQAFTSSIEDPRVAEFVRLYNANVNNVTGASSTIRPGRPTEALVKRLGTELPTVLQAKDSTDAKARIKLLQAAIKDAQKSSRLKSVTSSGAPQTLTDRLNEALGK